MSVPERLRDARHRDEVISPISPALLLDGTWWSDPWPSDLAAGTLEPRRGYRFRPENLALARMLTGERATGVVDLGTGTGSLLLIAHYLLAPQRAVGVERQPEMVERLRRTLEAHALAGARVVEGDLREPTTAESALEALEGRADLALMNPPYFPPDWGRPSAEGSTHASTHALHGAVGDFVRAAANLLTDEGRILAVFDAARLAELLAAAAELGFGPERMLWIPGSRLDAGQTPFRMWVELAHAGQGGVRVERL